MIIRHLVPEDLPALLRLQEDAYDPALLETGRAFLRKLEIFPQGCLCCEEDGHMHAYAMSHPWRGDREVKIDDSGLVIPDRPDCYYIHDLVVEREYQGRGLAGMLVRRIFDVARERKLAKLLLVAVQGAERFWVHYGFQPVRKLTYGLNSPATLMSRVIP